MRASILLFRPSVMFFALALVAFGSVTVLNAGESSAQKNDCSGDPTAGDYFCAGRDENSAGVGGGGLRKNDGTNESSSGGEGFGNQEETYRGRGGHGTCNIYTQVCTISGGGKRIDDKTGYGGRCVLTPELGEECTGNRDRGEVT